MAENKTVTNGAAVFPHPGFLSSPAAGSGPSATAITGPDLFAAMNAPATNVSASAKDDEDDDWGNFIDSSGDPVAPEPLPDSSKAPDLFGFPADRSGAGGPELARLDSGRNRIEDENRWQAATPWAKPRGPVPLSVFGVDEEEEGKDGSGGLDPHRSFVSDHYSNVDDKRGGHLKSTPTSGVGVGINDLIASLYSQSEQCKAENGANPDLNSGSSSYPGMNLHTNATKSSWNLKSVDSSGLMMNGNVSNLGKPAVTNAGLNGLDLDLNGLDLSKKISGLEASPVNLSRKSLNSDTKASDSGKIVSATPNANWSPVGLASSQTAPKQDTGVANLNWDPLSFRRKQSNIEKSVLDSNNSGVNLDSNVTNLGNENADFDENNEWDFKTAESHVASADENAKSDEKTTNGMMMMDGNLKRLNSDGIELKGTPVNNDTPQLMSDAAVDNEDWDDDDDGWEFKVAEPEASTTHSTNLLEGKELQDKKGAQHAFAFTNGGHHNTDLFAGVNGSAGEPGGWGFNSVPMISTAPQNGTVFNSTRERLNLLYTTRSAASEENSGAFRDSSSEIIMEDKEEPVVVRVSSSDAHTPASDDKKGPKLEKLQGPLPLSIFGDGELENDDQLVQREISAPAFTSSASNQMKSPTSNVSFSDLISRLYGEAAEKTSVNLTEKPSETGFSSAQIGVDSNMVNDDGDCDDDSWEFKGVTSGNGPDSQNSTPSTEGQQNSSRIKLGLNDYVDFYTMLKDVLCQHALSHLENLQKAQVSAADSGESSGSKEPDEDIQDLRNQLYQGIIPGEVKLENLTLKAVSIDQFNQLLREPKFQGLEPEHDLAEGLSLARNDWKLTLKLLKHATLMLKILTSVSPEEQANYVSTWSSMVSVCAQELKRGSSIWKQVLEKNIQGQILSKPQGKKYVLALGEIYRVSEILSATARLYKLWISLNPATSMLADLSECATLWSISGLREALHSISNLSDINYDGSIADLQESIKHFVGLDSHTLSNHVFTSQQQTCRISLLSSGTVPGMRLVNWNEEQYFVTLANLWANLISREPPGLPNIHIGG